MLRKLLAVVVLSALPALLAAQRPAAPATPAAAAKPAVPHGVAMQVQGEVASPVQEVEGQNNQEGVNEAEDQNNDGQNDEGDIEQEGVDEPDGMNNDVDAGEQVDQAGEDQDEAAEMPAPPPGTAQVRQIGRHKP